MTAADGAPHTAPIPLTFPLLGDRVLLRPFETADGPAAHAVYGDAEVMRHVGEGGAVTPEQTARMIEGYRHHQRDHGFAFWAVVDRGTRELIGDAGLEVTAHGVELGYTLADVDNPASARVLEKLGILRRGRTAAFGRPHHCFELAPHQVIASGPAARTSS